MWHPDFLTAEIYSFLFHVFSTLGEGHCNVTEIYAVINRIVSQQISEIQGKLLKTNLKLLWWDKLQSKIGLLSRQPWLSWEQCKYVKIGIIF